jgi:cation:H+ antiporter
MFAATVCPSTGLLILIVGAELLTRAGGMLASRLGVPPIIIGLTIVAVGTSAPELAVVSMRPCRAAVVLRSATSPARTP